MLAPCVRRFVLYSIIMYFTVRLYVGNCNEISSFEIFRVRSFSVIQFMYAVSSFKYIDLYINTFIYNFSDDRGRPNTTAIRIILNS